MAVIRGPGLSSHLQLWLQMRTEKLSMRNPSYLTLLLSKNVIYPIKPNVNHFLRCNNSLVCHA